MRSGKFKAALDIAKDLHKLQGTPGSESLLLDAYAARVQNLMDHKLTVEAKALMDLVLQRYPAASARFAEVQARAAAQTGSLEELLRPLSDPALEPERRATIEKIVRQEVSDLGALAQSAVLGPGHSLSRAALALEKAFRAAIAGPVSDEVIALPEVSFRSPLASWKVLIRAIASFYRDDDEQCRQALDSIQPDSVPARLIPAMRAMLDGRTEPLSSAARALTSLVIDDHAKLKSALEVLDEAFEEEDERATLKAIRTAMKECRESAPHLVERLRQRIAVRSVEENIQTNEITPLMGGPPQEDLAFLHLLARSLEEAGFPPHTTIACATWDRFRETAVAQGWFKPNGPEVATLYLHMAGVLRKVDRDDLRQLQRVALKNGLGGYFLEPETLYQRACTLDPHTEAFSQWLGWAEQESDRRALGVAESWHEILPGDIEPVLYLMRDAQNREKYSKALQFAGRAEQIDAVNPEVRRARFRILAANAMFQIRKKKDGQAEETLAAMASLPQARQGDRPAFVAALRYVTSALRGRHAQAANHRAELVRTIESNAGAALLALSIGLTSKRGMVEEIGPPEKLAPEERATLPAITARLRALAADVNMGLALPESWMLAVEKEFTNSGQTLDAVQLRSLAEAALCCGNGKFAYAISTAGLTRGAPTEAGFLLVRAKSLPEEQRERKAVCAAAAAELARERRDMDVVGQAIAVLNKTVGMTLTLDQAREVLKRENAAPEFPVSNRKGPSYDDLVPELQCECPECRRNRGELLLEEDDDDDDAFADDFDMLPPGIPPPPPAIRAYLMDAIERGKTADEILRDLRLDGGAGRRKRGKR